MTTAILNELAHRRVGAYDACGPGRYPGSRNICDVVLPKSWAIEVKLARPFGDNGKPAERWSENLLYPYPGNTSALGDCIKLLGSGFLERKAIVVIGYEHSPQRTPLEPAIRSFELIAGDVLAINLSPRSEVVVSDLVHDSHRQARVYGWEVLGYHDRPA